MKNWMIGKEVEREEKKRSFGLTLISSLLRSKKKSKTFFFKRNQKRFSTTKATSLEPREVKKASMAALAPW